MLEDLLGIGLRLLVVGWRLWWVFPFVFIFLLSFSILRLLFLLTLLDVLSHMGGVTRRRLAPVEKRRQEEEMEDGMITRHEEVAS
jgi:hypothetical protein